MTACEKNWKLALFRQLCHLGSSTMDESDWTEQKMTKIGCIFPTFMTAVTFQRTHSHFSTPQKSLISGNRHTKNNLLDIHSTYCWNKINYCFLIFNYTTFCNFTVRFKVWQQLHIIKPSENNQDKLLNNPFQNLKVKLTTSRRINFIWSTPDSDFTKDKLARYCFVFPLIRTN